MRGLALSLIIHVGIIAAGAVYLPSAVREFEASPVVPVDLVTLADVTNVRAAAPEPEPEPEIEEDPVEEVPEEEPTIDDAIAEPVPAVEPEPAAPESEPELIDITPTEPEPDPEPVEPEPEPEPEDEIVVTGSRIEREDVPATDSLADLLGDLEREVAEAREERAEDTAETRRRSAGAGTEMTATLTDLLNSHIRQSRCWRISLDAPYPEQRVVTVTMNLNRDGTISGSPRIDEARSRDLNDRFRPVVRERALRAAVQCAPYPLPPAQYDQWRLIRVNFGPDNSTP